MWIICYLSSGGTWKKLAEEEFYSFSVSDMCKKYKFRLKIYDPKRTNRKDKDSVTVDVNCKILVDFSLFIL